MRAVLALSQPTGAQTPLSQPRIYDNEHSALRLLSIQESNTNIILNILRFRNVTNGTHLSLIYYSDNVQVLGTTSMSAT